MGLISIPTITDGSGIDANDVNNPLNTIVNELNGNLDYNNLVDAGITYSKLAASTITSIGQAMYPVGSIYINATNSSNPSSVLGFGTWVAFGAGRVPVGYDSGDADFNASEKTGGDKNMQAHTHATDSQGNHAHGMGALYGLGAVGQGSPNRVALGAGSAVYYGNVDTTTNGAHTHTALTSGTGTTQNLQPYITVYMWKRTA